MQSDTDKVRCRWCGHKSRNVKDHFQHLADAHNRRDALESCQRLDVIFPLHGGPTYDTQSSGTQSGASAVGETP
jgi:hypothetical protein